MILVSSTEPEGPLTSLGELSTAPEAFGVDFLTFVDGMNVGFQRKKVPDDLLNSLNDERLAREIAQMQSLDVRVLILEGRMRWTKDGELMHSFGHFNKTQLVGFELSMQHNHGVVVLWTESEKDTAWTIRAIINYLGRKKRSSLLSRKKSQSWVGSTEYEAYLMEAVPGIGNKTAADIVEKFGVGLLECRLTDEELLSVPGVGKKTVEAIRRSFP